MTDTGIADRTALDDRHIGRLGRLLAAAALALGCGIAAARAAPTEIQIPGDRAFPESITSTADGTLYIGSLAEGMIFRVPPGGAAAEPWIKPGTSGLLSVIGVLADERSGTLWVCSSDLSSMGVSVPGGQGPTSLKAFDLKTGTAKGSVPLPGSKTFCNDIAIGPDGAAYVTDSLNPHILRLRPGAGQFEVWAQDQRFGGQGFNLDGIAFGGDGQLYANTYDSGHLFRVEVRPDHSAGPVTQLQTSQPIDHPDGMRKLGSNTLLMVEGAGRFDLISVSGNAAKVEVLKGGYKGPVSVTQVGDTAWVLEGQLGYLFDPKLKGQKPGPFRAYAVPLQVGR